jgi:hypothetical protein
VSQRARSRLERIAEQLAGLTRGDGAARVAEELRALNVQVVDHRGPEPMLAFAKFDRPHGLHLASIEADARDGVVVITERDDDPPEVLAARDAKLEELRRRGFGDVPVVIVRTLSDHLSVDRGSVARPPPPRATSSEPATPSPSRDPFQSEEIP